MRLTTLPSSLCASISSFDESVFLCCPIRRGKTIRRAWYALRRSTLAMRDSVERLARRGSTDMPMVGAYFFGIPASYELHRNRQSLHIGSVCGLVHTFNSAREKPRPARTRRLYLIVGHRTTGRSLSTGRGATAVAFVSRALRRRSLRPGCSADC